MATNSLIVKVNSKSSVRFCNCKVYRAITTYDLNKLLEKNRECHLLIIEGIYEEEQDDIKEIITDFLNKDKDNRVIFYIPDEDDGITSGIADELDYTIYLNLSDLYRTIYDEFKINVSSLLLDNKRLNSAELQETLPEGVTDFFSSMKTEDIDKDIKEAEDIIHEKEIEETKENVVETTKEVEITEDIEEETKVEIEDTMDNIEVANTDDIEPLEDIDEDENNLADANEEYKKDESLSEDTQKRIDDLELQLRDAKYDYSVVLKDMREAVSSISELEDMVRVLQDEKEEFNNKYSQLVDDDTVLEDPISLVEYEELKEDIEELKKSNSELKEKLESKKEKLEKLTSEIEELENSKTELSNNYSEAADKLDNTEIKLKETESLLEENTARLDEAIENIKQLEEESNKKSEEINLRESEIAKQLEVTSEQEEKIDEQLKKIKEQSKKIEELNNFVTNADDKIKVASEESNKKVEELNKTLSDVNSRLKFTTEQLKDREEQYNKLVATSGMDEKGASKLLENNNTLQKMNNTLNEQFNKLNKELGSANEKEKKLLKEIQELKEDKNHLNSIINNFGGSSKGAVANVEDVMKDIQYNEQAVIIPVFGSGSFGITSTAMSIANRLSPASRVVYVDFDIITPKADTWFGMNPICKGIPGLGVNDIRATGLSVFLELGIGTFEKYYNSLVKSVEATKSGRLDYISGVYHNIDATKLMVADYSTFLKFLASKYQYIIIDFGRLGSNKVTDYLIKLVGNVSLKGVAVTTNDKFDIRNFKLKLTDNKYDTNRIAWLLNLCTSTSIDEKTKAQISPSKYCFMTLDMDIFGRRKTFLNNKINKDKFELFMNSCLFSH